MNLAVHSTLVLGTCCLMLATSARAFSRCSITRSTTHFLPRRYPPNRIISLLKSRTCFSSTLAYYSCSSLSASTQQQQLTCTTVGANHQRLQEVLVVSSASALQSSDIEALTQLRPDIEVIHQSLSAVPIVGAASLDACVWTAFRGGIQLECAVLEPAFLGERRLSPVDTALQWDRLISTKRDYLRMPAEEVTSLGDGGSLQAELDAAVKAVQRTAYMIRSLQHLLLNEEMSKSASNKDDSSPVTIADFAAQALIVDYLSGLFPTDDFIAEEDSQLLRSNAALSERVIAALNAATGDHWTQERACAALDKGQYSGSVTSTDVTDTTDTTDVAAVVNTAAAIAGGVPRRVWVLDPIDGTKGFMRGAHCCIALGLMIEGSTSLSVMGCPNINLLRLLQSRSYDIFPVAHIDEAVTLSVSSSPPEQSQSQQESQQQQQQQQSLRLFNVDSGSIYYAVTGRGAFARTLSMPLGAAFEVSASSNSNSDSSSTSTLCESAEASFGSREVTAAVAQTMGLRNPFIRIDGMCKHCLVGVGAADGTLRLPPRGYREKIWDHVAGEHFVREAGGVVTDLCGELLDFSCGRLLPAAVAGVVVASNAAMHARLLDAVQQAQLAVAAAQKEKKQE